MAIHIGIIPFISAIDIGKWEKFSCNNSVGAESGSKIKDEYQASLSEGI